ncbi:beta-ketoacyl-ACP synthase III [Solicola gregarius]|uniref:Beta-ketoacyl-[acyl-carrier-protein] synthase III n=1 Tax=Solicola gregarius TaxID=2908642 RepID=A0AA46TI80_9ACTN|nr:beta-ketoacyl-ACP synthase III [Solicola gregarius]UYM05615.1 ketoacyl-ACP synthase III [Solicola gregarius]
MTHLGISPNVRASGIHGVGAYRPRRIVPNSDIIDRIHSSDDWIRTRSGITTRRFAEPDETVQMMSVSAARDAIAAAGLEASDIDCVIVATVSHLMQTPAVATTIADELGCSPAAAFDISAACAGFCYALSLASDMVRVGTSEHTLVIGVERLSDITNPDDRSTAFIFADGAGAVVVGPSDTPRIGPVVWGSDGDKAGYITQTRSWDDVFADDELRWPTLHMEGNPVFRWASFEMAKTAREALDRAGVDPTELDVFVPHQANMRITDAMARTLKLPENVAIARDIAEQGNTSAASIPLALERMIADGEAKSGQSALFIAFGAGLVYAAQVVIIP